jgi:hypothetical protein
MGSDTSVMQPEYPAVAEEPVAVNSHTRPGMREVVLASLFLAIIGALVYAPYVLHGGLYSDDWRDAAETLYPPGGPGFGNAVSYFAEFLSGARPVVIVFLPLKYLILGIHIKYLLALSVGLAVIVAALVYAIFRVLGAPWYHAGLIAALTIPYPWFDSTRLWETGSLATLGIAFALAGLLVALIGLSRGSWRLHVGAAVLYLLSVLTYEVTLPFIAAAGALYALRFGWPLRFGWRRARRPWGTDLLVVAIGGLWAWTHTPSGKLGASGGGIGHAWEIVVAGGELLGRTLMPLGPRPHTTLTLLVLAVIFAGGLLAYRLLPGARGERSEWGLRDWLLLGAGGLVVAALGWLTFIPATSYYTPSIFGVTNRVNALAGFGLIVAVYAALGVVGALLGRLVRRPGLAVATTLLLGLVLGATYVHVLQRHSRLWEAAYRAELVGANQLQAVFPNLPRGTAVFASNYPANLTLGVPIFSATWDLNGMIKLLYGDGSLRAFLVSDELGLKCQKRGVSIGGGGGVVEVAPYGTARLLDLTTGGNSIPRNQKQCLAERDSYPPGPLYLSYEY